MDRKSILGFAVGPIGAGLLSFVSLPVMTWIFPPDMIGKLSMLQVAIGLSIVASCLGLDQAYAREYHESQDRQSLLWNTTVPGLILLVCTLLLLLTISPALLSRLLFGVSSFALSALVSICLIVAYISRFLSIILRMQNRGFAYSMSQVLSGTLLLLIVVSYVLFTRSRTFAMLILAQTSALILTLAVFAWNTRSDWVGALRIEFQGALLKRVLSFGFPLVFAGVASWGVATLDRVFLRSMSTFSELAVYSVAASVAAGVTIIAGIFNTIWAPVVYKWVADNLDAATRIERVASQMAIVLLMFLCLVGGASWILRYILPIAYERVPFLVVGCIIAPMFYTFSEVTGIGIPISRRTVFSLIASGSAVLLDVALCLIFVPRFGALGAMIATASAFWLFFILRTEFSACVWHRFPRLKLHAYALASLGLAVAYAIFGVRLSWLGVAGWWLLLGALAYRNRSLVCTVWRVVMRQFSQASASVPSVRP